MHNAPPVVYPVGRFVWGRRWATCALALLSAVAMGASFVLSGATLAGLFWQAATWLVIAGLSAGVLSREFLGCGALAWDGESWHGLDTAMPPGPLQMALTFDGGHFMLVALKASPAEGRVRLSRHAFLCRGDMPSRWHGFRCAVYSRRMTTGA